MIEHDAPTTETVTATQKSDTATPPETTEAGQGKMLPETALPKEVGGRGGPDPTRYGDWEKNGRCIDF